MGLVSEAITLSLVCFVFSHLGHARSLIKRDVPPIAIPINPAKYNQITTANHNSVAPAITSKNVTIHEPHVVHESHPNPPVPTPPNYVPHAQQEPATETKNATTSTQEDTPGNTKKYGFGDKYLASQNKFAVRRNVIFDVVAGDAMSFSNYNVLGNQEVTFPRTKRDPK